MKGMILKFGKPVCVLLYAAFAYLAAKKKPWPLVLLFLMHGAEYLFIGRKVAAEAGVPRGEAAAQCLSFGFTWWLPLREKWR